MHRSNAGASPGLPSLPHAQRRLASSLAVGALLWSTSLAGCVQQDPFSWISAEWVDCKRVASIWTEDGTGGFARRDVACDSVAADPAAGPELIKACDFEVAKPASCEGGGDTIGGDGDATVTPDDGAASEVSEVVDDADVGPEAEVIEEVAPEVIEEVTPEVLDDILEDVPSETVAEVLGDVPSETGVEVLQEVIIDAADDAEVETGAADAEVDAGPPNCAMLAPECQTGMWNEDAGKCDFFPVTGSCDDGNACTENDTCAGGQCVGEAKDCDDGIPCTEDICVGAGSCQHVATACECQFDNDCNAPIACNTSVCNESLECEASPVADGTACSTSALSGQCKVGECLGVQEVSIGYYHACARLPLGEVKCWGLGDEGQLGTGSPNSVGDDYAQVVPTVVDLGEPAISIAAGGGHSCAVLASGTVRCWGRGSSGQLGAGNDLTLMDSPAEPASTVNLEGDIATAVAAGTDHTCAVTSLGNVRCWGAGGDGRLGSDDTEPLMKATEESASTVVMQSAFSSVSLGSAHTCAIGGLYVRCWGSGVSGQLGNESTDSILDGVGADGPNTVYLMSSVTDLSVGDGHSCAIADGAVRCWGWSFFGQTGAGSKESLLDGIGAFDEASNIIPNDGSYVQVAAGGFHTCARTTTGAVHCWGRGLGGATGSGDDENLMDDGGETPATPITSGASAIFAGLGNSCAIVGGQVTCWGGGIHGILGYPALENIGDAPGEIPGPNVNLMGADGSACGDPADCSSGVCVANVCTPN